MSTPRVTPESNVVDGSTSLRSGADGRLWLGTGSRRRRVKPVPCFPWSEPGHYVSLRDDDDAELGLVVDAEDLAPDSRQALRAALAEAGFVFEVTRVVDVTEEIEIRTWTVVTGQGPRTFQTARDAWPRQLPSGDYLIRDVAGDLYRVRDPESLDAQSRRHLWAFVE